MYDLGHVLFLGILAVLSGATSYRKIERFVSAHSICLNRLPALQCNRAPAHSSFRYALQSLAHGEVEAAFRDRAA